MRRAARVDENQAEIIAVFRKCGAVVTPMHQLGGGVSDLLISYKERWHVVEVKTEDGKLTPDQVQWIGRQRAPVHLVRSPMEAVNLLRMLRP